MISHILVRAIRNTTKHKIVQTLKIKSKGLSPAATHSSNTTDSQHALTALCCSDVKGKLNIPP